MFNTEKNDVVMQKITESLDESSRVPAEGRKKRQLAASAVDKKAIRRARESLSELDELVSAENQFKILSREGNYKSSGIPFFIERIGQQGRVRTNKSHLLRQKDLAKFKLNCQPLSRNYLLDRLNIGEKHITQCLQKRMGFVEERLIQEYRFRNLPRVDNTNPTARKEASSSAPEEDTSKAGERFGGRQSRGVQNGPSIAQPVTQHSELAHLLNQSTIRDHTDDHTQRSIQPSRHVGTRRRSTSEEEGLPDDTDQTQLNRVVYTNQSSRLNPERLVETKRSKTSEGNRVKIASQLRQSFDENQSPERHGAADGAKHSQQFSIQHDLSTVHGNNELRGSAAGENSQLKQVEANMLELSGLQPVHRGSQFRPIESRVQKLCNLHLARAIAQEQVGGQLQKP